MALIVITLQDGDEGVAVGVQAEPAPPRVVSKVPLTPAQQLASAMLKVAERQQVSANGAGAGIVISH